MSSVGIVGPGRVGQTIGRLAAESSEHNVVGIVGRSDVDGASRFVGQGQPMLLQELVGVRPEVVLVTVQDSMLSGVVGELAGLDLTGVEVIHCSGALGADVLSPCLAVGAQIGAIHPVCSFSTPERGVETFLGTPCVVEGEQTPRAEQLMQDIGGKLVRMPTGGDKARYHAAIAIACNYLYTLHGTAHNLLRDVGFNEHESSQLLQPIMHNALANSFELGPKDALTGPVVRGDVDVVQAHLDALPRSPAEVYRALGLATAELAGDRVSVEALQQIRTVLSD